MWWNSSNWDNGLRQQKNGCGNNVHTTKNNCMSYNRICTVGERYNSVPEKTTAREEKDNDNGRL